MAEPTPNAAETLQPAGKLGEIPFAMEADEFVCLECRVDGKSKRLKDLDAFLKHAAEHRKRASEATDG